MKFFKRIKRFLQLFWHLFHTTIQMLYGSWRISKLPHPIVTIFGGAHLKMNTMYEKQAHELGLRLVEHNISILTGGGPGIMQAASCGIHMNHTGKGRTMGIGVSRLGEKPNLCADEYFELEYFYARKWLLTQHSIAFIIFPGGFGTLDELTGVLTLIQTKHLKKVPVVLIGKEYWAGFIQWMQNKPLKEGFINPDDLEFFKVTDDLDDAFCWVLGKCEILAKTNHFENK